MTFEKTIWELVLHLQFSSRQESTPDRLRKDISYSDDAMADPISSKILTDIPSGPAAFDVAIKGFEEMIYLLFHASKVVKESIIQFTEVLILCTELWTRIFQLLAK